MPFTTSAMTTPVKPARAASVGSTARMPMPGSDALPRAMSWGTIRFTRSTGIARPTPADAPEVDRIAVFTPMSRPALSMSGPPELPGFTAASVWMAPAISRNSEVGRLRSSALTMPEVSVRDSPKGFPMAYTVCPMRTSRDEPSGMGFMFFGTSASFTTARS